MSEGREGLVRAVLPNGLFDVEVEGGARLQAHLAGPLRAGIVRLIAGDRVLVEVSAFDAGKARIVARRAGASPGRG